MTHSIREKFATIVYMKALHARGAEAIMSAFDEALRAELAALVDAIQSTKVHCYARYPVANCEHVDCFARNLGRSKSITIIQERISSIGQTNGGV